MVGTQTGEKGRREVMLSRSQIPVVHQQDRPLEASLPSSPDAGEAVGGFGRLDPALERTRPLFISTVARGRRVYMEEFVGVLTMLPSDFKSYQH